MSKQMLVSLIGRAAIDKDFLCQLQDNPEKAVESANCSLSNQEFVVLKGINFRGLEDFYNSASDRKLMASFQKKG
jgi:hypothetical protein